MAVVEATGSRIGREDGGSEATQQDNYTIFRQLKTLWHSLASSPHRFRIWLLSGGIVLAIGLNMVGQVRLNNWKGDFYNALEQANADEFIWQIGVFIMIVAVLLTMVVAETWIREMLEVRLREWLTHDLLDQWLSPNRAYLLGFAGEIGENPDQRMQADCQRLTEFGADLAIGLLRSTLLLLSFIGVLWGLSNQVVFSFDGAPGFTIPGYLVWCALFYALSGSWLTWLVGRPLIAINAERYAREADLRFGLVRHVFSVPLTRCRGVLHVFFVRLTRYGGILHVVGAFYTFSQCHWNIVGAFYTLFWSFLRCFGVLHVVWAFFTLWGRSARFVSVTHTLFGHFSRCVGVLHVL
ncbi:MAG: SbmA/BacA-like family transporter [Pseudomonadota bacterium]